MSQQLNMNLSLSKQMAFSTLANVLQRCSDARNLLIRKENFVSLINKWRDAMAKKSADVGLDEEDNVYYLLRLVLPQVDISRPAYGLKDKSLSNLFANVMGIAKGTSLYKDLVKFESDENGDLAREISALLVKMNHYAHEASQISIWRVNRFLDNLPRHTDETVKREFRTIINGLSPEAVKWFISIILKKVYFGLNTSVILSLIHKDAPLLFLHQSDLRRICSVVPNRGERLSQAKCHELCEYIFVHPMLAQRRAVVRLQKELGDQHFFIETKYDGERFQMHKKGSSFMYFTRRGFSKYSAKFGTTFNEGTLTPALRDAFPSDIDSIILDGEMMHLDIATGKFVGMAQANKNVKTSGKRAFGVWEAEQTEGLDDCYVVFDVLYVNGKTLVDVPFEQRLDILDRVVNPVAKKLVFAQRKSTRNSADIAESLKTAITNGDEGLILKKANSRYHAGVRGAGDWFKVKPDFSDQLLDTLDLLVMGADYGDHRHHNVLHKFTCGVRTENGDEFFAIASVGGGFTDEKTRELNSKLLPLARKTATAKPPRTMHFHSMPTFWFPVDIAPVFCIKATDVVPSGSFPLGRSLRFPQFRSVRDSSEVNYENCFSDSEFKQMELGSLARTGVTIQEIATAEDGPVAKKPCRYGRGVSSKVVRAVGAVTVEERTRLNEIAAAAAKTYLSGKEVCVYHPPDEQVREIQESLAKFGAKYVAEASLGRTHLVVSYKNSVRVQSLSKHGHWDVLTGDWFNQCCRENAVITPRNLSDFFYATPRTRQYIADQFGNAYVGHLHHDDLKEMVERIGKEVEKPSVTREEVEDFMDEISSSHSVYYLFRHLTAYFIGPKGKFLTDGQFYFTLYGGVVVHDPEDAHITHFVSGNRMSGDKDWSQVAMSKRAHFVNTAWIEDCIKEHSLLEDRFYLPAF